MVSDIDLNPAATHDVALNLRCARYVAEARPHLAFGVGGHVEKVKVTNLQRLCNGATPAPWQERVPEEEYKWLKDAVDRPLNQEPILRTVAAVPVFSDKDHNPGSPPCPVAMCYARHVEVTPLFRPGFTERLEWEDRRDPLETAYNAALIGAMRNALPALLRLARAAEEYVDATLLANDEDDEDTKHFLEDRADECWDGLTTALSAFDFTD